MNEQRPTSDNAKQADSTSQNAIYPQSALGVLRHLVEVAESTPFNPIGFVLEHCVPHAKAIAATDPRRSLEALLTVVQRHPGTGSACVIASVLCSLYNGRRCKVDLTDLRVLDQANFEHVLNVLRLDHSPVCEVHEYFENGGEIWEQMFADYGFDRPAGRQS